MTSVETPRSAQSTRAWRWLIPAVLVLLALGTVVRASMFGVSPDPTHVRGWNLPIAGNLPHSSENARLEVLEVRPGFPSCLHVRIEGSGEHCLRPGQAVEVTTDRFPYRRVYTLHALAGGMERPYFLPLLRHKLVLHTGRN